MLVSGNMVLTSKHGTKVQLVYNRLIFYTTKGNQSVSPCNVSDGVRWDVWKHNQKLSWCRAWGDRATREPWIVNTWSLNSVTITIVTDTSSTNYIAIRHISIDIVIFLYWVRDDDMHLRSNMNCRIYIFHHYNKSREYQNKWTFSFRH